MSLKLVKLIWLKEDGKESKGKKSSGYHVPGSLSGKDEYLTTSINVSICLVLLRFCKLFHNIRPKEVFGLAIDDPHEALEEANFPPFKETCTRQ